MKRGRGERETETAMRRWGKKFDESLWETGKKVDKFRKSNSRRRSRQSVCNINISKDFHCNFQLLFHHGHARMRRSELLLLIVLVRVVLIVDHVCHATASATAARHSAHICRRLMEMMIVSDVDIGKFGKFRSPFFQVIVVLISIGPDRTNRAQRADLTAIAFVCEYHVLVVRSWLCIQLVINFIFIIWWISIYEENNRKQTFILHVCTN